MAGRFFAVMANYRGAGMKITYICDICGQPQETVELEDVEIEKLGINTLTHIEKEDIIKYNDEQGLLLYSLCPACFEENYLKEPQGPELQ